MLCDQLREAVFVLVALTEKQANEWPAVVKKNRKRQVHPTLLK